MFIKAINGIISTIEQSLNQSIRLTNWSTFLPFLLNKGIKISNNLHAQTSYSLHSNFHHSRKLQIDDYQVAFRMLEIQERPATQRFKPRQCPSFSCSTLGWSRWADEEPAVSPSSSASCSCWLWASQSLPPLLGSSPSPPQSGGIWVSPLYRSSPSHGMISASDKALFQQTLRLCDTRKKRTEMSFRRKVPKVIFSFRTDLNSY